MALDRRPIEIRSFLYRFKSTLVWRDRDVSSLSGWHPDGLGIEAAMLGLMLEFPGSEKFIIKTLSAVASTLPQGDALRYELQLMCGQESQHQLAHQRLNKRLSEESRILEFCARYFESSLELESTLLRKMPTRFQILWACAMEQAFGRGARRFLGQHSPEHWRKHPVAALYAWHAFEEAEHCRVTSDLMERLGMGSGQVRTLEIVFMLWSFVKVFPMLPLLVFSLYQLQSQKGKKRLKLIGEVFFGVMLLIKEIVEGFVSSEAKAITPEKHQEWINYIEEIIELARSDGWELELSIADAKKYHDQHDEIEERVHAA